ncbi:hypothetical protein GH733_008238 [Mirounga leonina]|nr:hypothetical protein GH733_008238 [Mirounga leonina]
MYKLWGEINQDSILIQHQKIHSGEKLCNQCDRGFRETSKLVKHQRIHTGKKPHIGVPDVPDVARPSKPCNYNECGNAFNQRANSIKISKFTQERTLLNVKSVGKALVNHCTSGGKACKCHRYGKGFSQTSYLVTHQRIHTGEKPYMCSICRRGFVQITEHILERSECSECGKSFSQSSILTRRQVIHTMENTCEFNKCVKLSGNASHGKKTHPGIQQRQESLSLLLVIRHLRAPIGENSMDVMNARKAFTWNSHLICNQIIHRGCDGYERLFLLLFCFQDSFGVRTHAGEKPFKHEECRKPCGHLQHGKIHSVEESYGCKECGKAFSQKSQLIPYQRIILERNPVNAMNMEMLSIRDRSLRSPVNAVRVGKPSFKTHCIFSNKDRGRPYVCGVWKTFSQSPQLTPHWRVHPGEEQRKCNECRKPLFRVHILLYIK